MPDHETVRLYKSLRVVISRRLKAFVGCLNQDLHQAPANVICEPSRLYKTIQYSSARRGIVGLFCYQNVGFYQTKPPTLKKVGGFLLQKGNVEKTAAAVTSGVMLANAGKLGRFVMLPGFWLRTKYPKAILKK